MRRILVLIALFAVIIVIGISVLFHNRVSSLENLAEYNDKQVSMAPIQAQTKPQLLVDGTGAIYEWSNHTLWKPGKSAPIAQVPNAVFPLSEGVGFIKEHCLCQWSSIGTEMIANNVSAACWDGASFVWMDANCSVFEMTEQGKRQIFEIDKEQLGEPEIMLASSRWIILGPYGNRNFFQSLLIYDRQKNQSSLVSLSMDGRDCAFLCEDNLIKIGGAQDIFCNLDLVSLEKTNYASGIVADQGDVTASAAYDQEHRVFYVSVCSKPELPEFYEINTATFALNLQNNTIDRINNRFFGCLGIRNGSVYGAEEGLFGSWKTVLLSNK